VNLPLASLALSAFPASGSPRSDIAAAAEHGVRAAQLDAARPGFRPRGLDRSARRDLAASLRRAELEFSGLDLWIPPHHFTSPEHTDRAVAATISALELAAELAALCPGSALVAVTLPPEADPGLRRDLDAAAALAGATLADHAWPPSEPVESRGLVPGIDAAAVILAGDDPVAAVGRGGFKSARIADLSARGPCVPGDPAGRLDVAAFVLTSAVAGDARHLVIDPRGLSSPADAVPAALAIWPDPVSFPDVGR